MNNVIHTTVTGATGMDLDKYVYDEVYASVDASPTINGTLVTIPAGRTISILVQSISETANVYVLGRRKIIAPTVING